MGICMPDGQRSSENNALKLIKKRAEKTKKLSLEEKP
jgi:hypothetical protein